MKLSALDTKLYCRGCGEPLDNQKRLFHPACLSRRLRDEAESCRLCRRHRFLGESKLKMDIPVD